MNLKKINTIISREYATRVKKKSFILMTILTPIFLAAMMILPSVMMYMDMGGDQQEILVVDQSGIVAPTLESTSKIKYSISEDEDIERLRSEFDKLDVYALAYISALDASNNVSITTYSTKQLNMDIKSSLQKSANDAISAYKLTTYDIENLDKILKDVKTNVKIDTYTISDGGDAKASMTEIYMAISFVFGIIIYFFIVLFGNMVMRSVIEEKSSRIVEVIISSVKPFELMIGKIVGVALVALTQFAIWIVLALVLVFGFSAAVGMDKLLGGGENQEIVTNMASMPGAEAGVPIEEIAAIAASESSQIGVLLEAISQINVVYLLGVFLIYFVLSYLLYASMFAAVGSAVDNEADTQQLAMPMTLPLIIGFLIMVASVRNPDTPLAFWGSIIPFTSPMVMVARLPFGVPFWELALSIGLLLGTFLLMTYISAKIYRVGILSYGKKANWKDLWKWIKF